MFELLTLDKPALCSLPLRSILSVDLTVLHIVQTASLVCYKSNACCLKSFAPDAAVYDLTKPHLGTLRVEMHAVPHPMQSADCCVTRHIATTLALLHKMHSSRIPVVAHPWALHTRAF